jgi:hypothetical protein
MPTKRKVTPIRDHIELLLDAAIDAAEHQKIDRPPVVAKSSLWILKMLNMLDDRRFALNPPRGAEKRDRFPLRALHKRLNRREKILRAGDSVPQNTCGLKSQVYTPGVTADNLIPVPTAETLLAHIRSALSEAAADGWNALSFDAIASSIAKRVKDLPHIYCYSGRPSKRPAGCDDSEWLFDFTALLYEEPNGVRFLVQPAIVGEIEWNPSNKGTDEDFERLLMVDSIVCFFVCGASAKKNACEKVKRYERIIRVRRKYSELRGTRSPAFLLACYIEPRDHTTGDVELLESVIA